MISLLVIALLEFAGFLFIPMIAQWDKKHYEKLAPSMEGTVWEYVVYCFWELMVFNLGLLVGLVISNAGF